MQDVRVATHIQQQNCTPPLIFRLIVSANGSQLNLHHERLTTVIALACSLKFKMPCLFPRDDLPNFHDFLQQTGIYSQKLQIMNPIGNKRTRATTAIHQSSVNQILESTAGETTCALCSDTLHMICCFRRPLELQRSDVKTNVMIGTCLACSRRRSKPNPGHAMFKDSNKVEPFVRARKSGRKIGA